MEIVIKINESFNFEIYISIESAIRHPGRVRYLLDRELRARDVLGSIAAIITIKVVGFLTSDKATYGKTLVVDTRYDKHTSITVNTYSR